MNIKRLEKELQCLRNLHQIVSANFKKAVNMYNYHCDVGTIRDDELIFSYADIREMDEFIHSLEVEILEKEGIIQTFSKRCPRHKKWARKGAKFGKSRREYCRIEKEKANLRDKRFAREHMLREVELLREANLEEEEALRKEREEYDEECRSQGMMDLIDYMNDEEELDELIARISEGEIYLESEAQELAKRYYLGEKRVDEAVRLGLIASRNEAYDDIDPDYWEDYRDEFISGKTLKEVL